MKVFTAPLKVRTYECDFYGHVNNAVYLNYLEYARMEALNEKGFTLENMKARGYVVVVRRVELDYKLPLFMGDEITIRTFTSQARNTSGVFTQQIIRNKDQRMALEAKITWVFTNLDGKPIPIPNEIREVFEIH